MIPRIRTVQIKNYKSLASVSVDLEPFTVFVGRNGSGKSNIFDALAFVAEALRHSPEVALSRRHGFEQVLNSGAARAVATAGRDMSAANDEKLDDFNAQFGVRLVVDLAREQRFDYSFEIAGDPLSRLLGEFKVARERCVVATEHGSHEFEVRDGSFVKEIEGIRPKLTRTKLALYAASSVAEFSPVYDFLTSMRFYSINPVGMSRTPDPTGARYLARDGENSAEILAAERVTWRETVRIQRKYWPRWNGNPSTRRESTLLGHTWPT